jgi:hypothetical protein
MDPQKGTVVINRQYRRTLLIMIADVRKIIRKIVLEGVE